MKKIIALLILAATFTAYAESYRDESQRYTPMAGGEVFKYQNMERRTLNVPVPQMDLPAALTPAQQPVISPDMDVAQIEDILNKQVEALEAYMNARIKAAEETFARNEFKRDMMSKYEFRQLTKMQESKDTALARMQARRDAMVKAMHARMATPAAAPTMMEEEAAPAAEKTQKAE